MITEATLRATLLADADSVRPSPDLAERIVAELLQPAPGEQADHLDRYPPAWRNWLLPVIAAIIVAILVGSVLLARNLFQPAEPAATTNPTPTQSASPTPSTSPTPSSSGARIGVPPPVTTAPRTSAPVITGPAGGPVPAGFHAVDLTWISSQDGWGLGTAPCAKAPCTSLVRTADGGRSWVGIPAPIAELFPTGNCEQACVSELRFATSTVGYAFGANSLFMTTDGGATWKRESGQADALEIGNGTVLRVVSQGLGCRPACRYRLLRANVASSGWTAVPLPGFSATGNGVSLVRTGHRAAIEVYSNPAGGSSNATASLLTSADDGASWASRGEPCQQIGGGFGGNEVDSSGLTSAPDGSLTALCSPRGVFAGQFTATSTDGGRTFRTAPRSLGEATVTVGAASASVLLAASDAVYRSTDGGGHWRRVLVDASIPATGRPGAAFLGFETTTTGRYLTDDGKTVWTTTDAGGHWIRNQFG